MVLGSDSVERWKGESARVKTNGSSLDIQMIEPFKIDLPLNIKKLALPNWYPKF